MILDYRCIIDFIFPPSEDELLMRKSTIQNFPEMKDAKYHLQIVTLLPYKNKRVKSAIHLLKFHNHTHARRLLGHVLATYLQTIQYDNFLLIPIPLSSKRFRERGYNQVVEVLQEALKNHQHGTLATEVLTRTRHTTPQTSLSRKQRLTNLDGAFAIKNSKKITKAVYGKHIILVDDVSTTGSTLKTAETVLLPLHPASITCIALAH